MKSALRIGNAVVTVEVFHRGQVRQHHPGGLEIEHAGPGGQGAQPRLHELHETSRELPIDLARHLANPPVPCQKRVGSWPIPNPGERKSWRSEERRVGKEGRSRWSPD